MNPLTRPLAVSPAPTFEGNWGLFAVMLFFIALSVATPLQTAPRFAIPTANWTAVSWSTTNCAGPGGAAAPGVADDVTICPTRTVTLSTCKDPSGNPC